ncbi:MAG TPA: alkaline phosphatase D family protein [Archangium sp.]|nr:alkaline phosphatase D family protein [Archangium sp.]
MPQMLRPPSVGPIVGHTTDTSVRLWIRAADVADLRTVGVAALYEPGQPEPREVKYFRLHREYDRTGTVDFDGLKPNTRYTARLGSVSVDSIDSELIVDDKEVFAGLPEQSVSVWKDDFRRLNADEAAASFTTFPSPAEGGFSFLMGSCRYPGVMGESKRSDEIFHAMHQHVEQAHARDALPPRFVLMMGDQIYADKFNKIPVGRADTWREFQERYTTAFSTPYIRRLMRSLPTYMILDDHEIEDNWAQARLKDALKRDLFHNAIRAYMSYQWVHGPRNFDKRIHYSFECAQAPFFVLDVRTQRIRNDDDTSLRGNHLLGYPAKASAPGFKGQLDQFCDWLVEQQQRRGNVPKFVVSPGVFAPNDVASCHGAAGNDSWPAFPETRRRVLRTIVDNNVQNVVFLSGDVHCSNVSEIFFETSSGATLPLKAFSIVSSAFYWPFPFADGDPLGFVHDSKAEKDGFDIDGSVTMHYSSRGFEQDDNFTQVTYDTGRNALVVQNYSRKGKALNAPNELRLAPF